MPVSQNQRLRKPAAKAVKRKAVVAERLATERRALRISKPRHVDLASSPFAYCALSQDSENAGVLALNFARKLPLGRFAVAVFLVDLWCLGVKDAYFRIDEAEDFEMFQEAMQSDGSFKPIEPARARRLLRDAAAFGLANGFAPPPNFAEIERLLSDVEPAGEPFAFGDNGRPHYVVGEGDPRRDIDVILATLTEKFGPGGFDVTYPLEEDEFDEESDEPSA